MMVALDYRRTIAEILILEGAWINHRDQKGQTALHYAASYGGEAVVRLLAENGVETEAQYDR